MKTPDIQSTLAELFCPTDDLVCPDCEEKVKRVIAMINDEKAHSYGIGYRDAEKRAHDRHRVI